MLLLLLLTGESERVPMNERLFLQGIHSFKESLVPNTPEPGFQTSKKKRGAQQSCASPMFP
jgi:hypothetical protein